MLGGTDAYLILFGCLGTKAAEIRTDLLRGMQVVQKIVTPGAHFVADDLLESMAQPGFEKTITTQKVSDFALKNFNEKYQNLLNESSVFSNVGQYRELPQRVYDKWDVFQQEYYKGYGSLVGMYAEANGKGNPWSVVTTATAACNQQKARARTNQWYQDSRDMFGN